MDILSSISLEKLAGLFVYKPEEPLLFSSGLFLFLFLAFAAVYVALRRRNTARILFVTLFSYYFYYKSSGIYFFLLAVVTVSDFIIGRHLKRNKALLVLSLLIDLGLLCYFKYTNFFAGMLASLWKDNFQPWDIFLPVGISFFTFQSLSYTIDIYRGKIKPLDNLLDYAFYVSFFPQLVAGPIIRAVDFIPQIRKPLMVTQRMFADGVFLILCGLLKKAVISDYISINFVERVFESPQLYSGMENLLATYGYTLQIYCDFSGYSDMAIGIALLLGFRFPKNFNAPYKACSISDFWHRWHISLSSWLKDYLYISLGGNRRGRLRQYLNLMVTMLLGGLWHGASLNFILWGGIHGVALVADKVKDQLLRRPKGYRPTGLGRVLSTIITFHIVAFCWLFFRNATIDGAFSMLTQILTNLHPQIFVEWVESYSGVALLMFVGYVAHFLPASWFDALRSRFARTNIFVLALLLTVAIYLVIQVKGSEVQPFIYFQF